MEPNDLTYEISRCYVSDQTEVCPRLVAKVDGFRRSRNLAKLTSCSSLFDPAYHGVGEWRFLRQMEAFFKKNASFTSRDICAQAAAEAFIKADSVCRRTNSRLNYLTSRPGEFNPVLKKQVARMRRYVSSVLGAFTPFLDELPCLVRVTPGATSHASRRNSLPQLKMRMSLYSTKYSAKYVTALFRHFGFEDPRIKLTGTNRVELVPKNWKTDRTIACEPEGNLPLQLAFDTYAKRRLRLRGIDLSDQSANQRAAREASVTNTYVTVDFQAASDTISFEVVQSIFPVDWFAFLCDVRTPGYRSSFGCGTYHKFSSMGNGSTFAIETLIFAAACYAVGHSKFLVYGDDVIIHRDHYEEFLKLTRFLGFTINSEKTFKDGPFRESCGLDAYGGIDVTPVYIRVVDKRKVTLCHLVNSLASLAYPGSQLAALLVRIVTDHQLPLVPYQESTTSGVWIDPAVARALGTLRMRTYRRGPGRKRFRSWINEFKSYVPKSTCRQFVDIRGYYLWFLRKNSQVLFSTPWDLARDAYRKDDSTETSSAPTFDHTYVRKWVCWREPAEAMPVHLYWWTELLCPRPNGCRT